MSAYGQCPRGHDLAENAVYCTVCWVRVAPEDPERVAARRRRQRRVWFPLLGAGAVALGIAAGGTLGSSTGPVGDAVTAAAPVADVPVPASAEPTPMEEPVTVMAAPMAATFAEPTLLTVCVPQDASDVTVRIRRVDDQPWQDESADISLDGRGACPSDEVEATVSFDETLSEGTRVKIVARNDAGERLAALKVTVTTR